MAGENLNESTEKLTETQNEASAAAKTLAEELLKLSKVSSKSTNQLKAEQLTAESKLKLEQDVAKVTAQLSNGLNQVVNGVNTLVGSLKSFGNALDSAGYDLSKFGGAIQQYITGVYQLIPQTEAIGRITNNLAGAAGELYSSYLKQIDNTYKAYGSLSKFGEGAEITLGQFKLMANAAGYNAANMDKFTKAITDIGPGLLSFGGTVRTGVAAFSDLNSLIGDHGDAVQKDIDHYRKLGLEQDEYLAMQGQALNYFLKSGQTIYSIVGEQQDRTTALRKASNEYIDQLYELANITGKNVSDLQKSREQVLANTQYQLYLTQQNAQVETLRRSGRDQEADALQRRLESITNTLTVAKDYLSPERFAALQRGFATQGQYYGNNPEAVAGLLGLVPNLTELIRNSDPQKVLATLGEASQRRAEGPVGAGGTFLEDKTLTALGIDAGSLELGRQIKNAGGIENFLEQRKPKPGTETEQEKTDIAIDSLNAYKDQMRDLGVYFDDNKLAMANQLIHLANISQTMGGLLYVAELSLGVLTAIRSLEAVNALTGGKGLSGLFGKGAEGLLGGAKGALGKAGMAAGALAVGYGLYEGFKDDDDDDNTGQSTGNIPGMPSMGMGQNLGSDVTGTALNMIGLKPIGGSMPGGVVPNIPLPRLNQQQRQVNEQKTKLEENTKQNEKQLKEIKDTSDESWGVWFHKHKEFLEDAAISGSLAIAAGVVEGASFGLATPVAAALGTASLYYGGQALAEGAKDLGKDIKQNRRAADQRDQKANAASSNTPEAIIAQKIKNPKYNQTVFYKGKAYIYKQGRWWPADAAQATIAAGSKDLSTLQKNQYTSLELSDTASVGESAARGTSNLPSITTATLPNASVTTDTSTERRSQVGLDSANMLTSLVQIQKNTETTAHELADIYDIVNDWYIKTAVDTAMPTGGAGGGVSGGGKNKDLGDVAKIGGKTRSGGGIAWRANNPGDITAGATAEKLGALPNQSLRVQDPSGKIIKIAVFPDVETGRKAHEALLKEKYGNLNIADAVSYYTEGVTGGSHPELANIIRDIQKETGAKITTKLGDLNKDQFSKFAQVQEKWEGGQTPGKVLGMGGITDGISIAGEAGPEAVVPLPNGRSIPVELTGDKTEKLTKQDMENIIQPVFNNSELTRAMQELANQNKTLNNTFSAKLDTVIARLESSNSLQDKLLRHSI